MNKEMRTAVVALYAAVPPVSGVSSVTYNLVKYLPGQRNLIQLGNGSPSCGIEGDVVLTSIPAVTTGRMRKACAIAFQSFRMIKALKKFAPDVIVFEGASWVLYCLWFMLLLRLGGIGAKLVYHAHNVEYNLRREKNGSLVALITRWAEKRVLRLSDLTTAVSEVDKIHFEKLYGVETAILPNGVDVQEFDRVTEDQIARIRLKYGLTGPVVLFMGIPSYQPNAEAIRFLMGDIFPKVVEASPDARLAIIGGPIAREQPWLIAPGSIPYDELHAFIKACDVCVAPIFSGSGTRVKILEYMAAGRPVVSTLKGAEGLNVRSEQNIMIADRVQQFARFIVLLLNDPALADRIGHSGKDLVCFQYSWDTIVRDFSDKTYALRDQ